MTTPMSLLYQGWSGWLIQPQNGMPLVFDPAPDSTLPCEKITILITHGHPEHLQGALQHLRTSKRMPVTVIGSSFVCEHLKESSVNAEDIFLPVSSSDQFEISNWRVRVFEWKHMSLLPPGNQNKLRYIFKLTTHPKALLCIIRDGFGGPRHSPMLGFEIKFLPKNYSTLVYIGEGLHRRTSTETLTQCFGRSKDTALIAGVEPEDVDELPNLLQNRPLKSVLLFEPHREWRQQFNLPQLNPVALQQQLSKVGVAAHLLHPGERTLAH